MHLAELKLPVPAEEMLKLFVLEAKAKTPAAVLVMAEFLARQNRLSQALAICITASSAPPSAWKSTCGPSTVDANQPLRSGSAASLRESFTPVSPWRSMYSSNCFAG